MNSLNKQGTTLCARETKYLITYQLHKPLLYITTKPLELITVTYNFTVSNYIIGNIERHN